MELSLSLESVTTANVKPSAKHENGSSLDCIPLNDTFPHPSLSSATCSREISNCLQLILNNEYDHLSLSPSLQQSTWGTGRDVRGLQAKHKIEDKLELIICLFLYMCFKIKCKLNKVITELEREKKKAFLLQTADTSISFSLTTLNVICKCALPMLSRGNVFRKSQKRMENNSMGTQKKKKLNVSF